MNDVGVLEKVSLTSQRKIKLIEINGEKSTCCVVSGTPDGDCGFTVIKALQELLQCID